MLTHTLRDARDAVITVVLALVAFAALDDITTGNEPSFTAEYIALLVCAGWAVWLGVRLIRRRRLGARTALGPTE